MRRSFAILAIAPIVVVLSADSPHAATTLTRTVSGSIVADSGNTFGHAWGDYDQDGFVDLFACNLAAGEVNYLYRNNGDGTFARVLGNALDEVGPSTSASWADWDNDGDPDLFVANGGTVGSAVNFLYRNEGGGTFFKVLAGTPVAGNAPSTATSWVDVDNDGQLDLFEARSNAANRIHYSDGDGTFTRVNFTDSGGTWGVSFADYDDDGDMDFYASNWSLNNYLYRNDGGRSFTRITSGSLVTGGGLSLSASWGDYDNDGHLDLYVTNTQGSNRLFHNDGAGGTFTEVLVGSPVTDNLNSEASCWADYDNDADLDLLVSGGGNISVGTNRIYENDGAGSFTAITTGDFVTVTGRYEGLSCVDYDNDGDPDVFLSNYFGENNELYRNDLANGNHWLSVGLTGSVSNRSAIGARITAVATVGGVSVRQIREVTAHQGHVTQGDLRAHFGLGDASVIDSLLIRWPSGAEDVHTDILADQFVSLTEGETVTGVVTPPSAITIELAQNHPNPFHRSTRISYTTGREAQVRLGVYDVGGREVARLVDETRPAGWHAAYWHGRTGDDKRVAAGVYFYRLEVRPSGSVPETLTKRMELVR